MQRREDLENLIEQIDACRAGSDDIHAPELQELRQLEQRLEHDAQARELYDSLQNFDARLGAAVREVRLEEFPQASGLEARLLAAVSQNAASQNAVASDVSTGDLSSDATSSEPPTVRRTSRRRAMTWLVGLAATAATVGIVIGLMDKTQPDFVPTASWVHDTALDFYLADKDNIRTGRSIAQTPPPKSHPLSSQVRQFSEVMPGATWRHVSGFLGTPQAIAYDIPAPGGSPIATLYVVRLSVPDLPQWPNPKTDHGTGGALLSAWQKGDLVYVLVVHGDKNAFRQFIENLHREFA
ncbi:MAG: hypothetical protein IID44_30950 [Planctomycetes bacterium]|nr:hypothetical protein [Planctomycetota bacterium]